MFRGGLLPKPKLILDAAAHGSLMALSPKDAVDIINKMSLNNRAAKYNRNSAHRKSGILKLGSSDANLAQNKILTQQLEEMKNQMKEMPKLIKEQLRVDVSSPVGLCHVINGEFSRPSSPPK